MCPPQPELTILVQNCTIDIPHTPLLRCLFDVCLEGVFCMFRQEILLVYATQSERIVAPTILNCFIIRIM